MWDELEQMEMMWDELEFDGIDDVGVKFDDDDV